MGVLATYSDLREFRTVHFRCVIFAYFEGSPFMGDISLVIPSLCKFHSSILLAVDLFDVVFFTLA